MKKKKIGKMVIAKNILVSILSSAMDLNEIMYDLRRYQKASITGGREYVKFLKKMDDEKYMKRQIARLRRAKMIAEKKVSGRLKICLTEKGAQAALRYKILDCQDALKDKYYIVIFDIPESERRIRNLFRLFLKEAHFIRLQHSVWLTQKEIMEPLMALIKSAGAEKWIKIITAIDITNFKQE